MQKPPRNQWLAIVTLLTLGLSLGTSSKQFGGYILHPSAPVEPEMEDRSSPKRIETVHKIMNAGFLRRQDAQEFIDELSFNEVFAHMSSDAVLQLLLDRNYIRGEIDTLAEFKRALEKKGFHVDALNIRPDGILTAVGDLRGEGSLYKRTKDFSGQLMKPIHIRIDLQNEFEADKTTFLQSLHPQDIVELFGATKSNTPAKKEPLFLLTMGEHANPYTLQAVEVVHGANQSPVTNTWKRVNGPDNQSIQDIAKNLIALPPGKRVLKIQDWSIGLGFEHDGRWKSQLDPVTNRLGVPLLQENGIPFVFPSYSNWIQENKQRFRLLATKLKAVDAPIDMIIINNPYPDASWWHTRNEFQDNRKNISPLLFDPRGETLLETLGVSAEDMADFHEWQNGEEKQIRWNAYAQQIKNEATIDAIASPMKAIYPDIEIYAQGVFPRTTHIPTDRHYTVRDLWGYGAVEPLMPSHMLNGKIDPFTTPNGKIVTDPEIPEWEGDIVPWKYFTVFNSIIGNINRANTIASATSARTHHWVSTPKTLENYFGSNRDRSIGNAMAEIWYRAAANGNGMTLIDNENYDENYSKPVLEEINEMLGYTDRGQLPNGWFELNNERSIAGITPISFQRDIAVWGVQANGSTVYRVILNTDKLSTTERITELRKAAILNDGVNGGGVHIQVGSDELKIPYGRIVYPASEVSEMGFWVIQNVQKPLSRYTVQEVLQNANLRPRPPKAPLRRIAKTEQLEARPNKAHQELEEAIALPEKVEWNCSTPNSAAQSLASINVLQGENNTGNYNVDGKLNRAELATMVARLLKLSTTNPSTYADVTSTNWYSAAAIAVREEGLMNGYTDNTFRGGTLVTPPQVMKIVAIMLNLATVEDEERNNSWYGYYNQQLGAHNLYKGMKPVALNEPAKRGWIIQLLCNAQEQRAQ